jgi:hypothetical protein
MRPAKIQMHSCTVQLVAKSATAVSTVSALTGRFTK